MKNVTFTITFCEADTGIVLNKDGSWFNAKGSEKQYRPTFSTIDEARRTKDELLARKPNGEVVIESTDGQREVYYDELKLMHYIKERKSLVRWEALPPWIRWFRRRPTCELYDA